MTTTRQHGDPSMYRHDGCRCEKCKAAATAQTIASRRRKRAEVGPTADDLLAMTPLDHEEWRPAVGYDEYEVSNIGRVRSLKFTYPRLLAVSPHKNGYLRVRLWSDNKHRFKFVHGLVAEAFIGPYPPGEEVRHRDDNKADNRLSNLTYGTRSQNVIDSVWNGTQPQTKKTHCPAGHPYTPENTYVRPKGQKGWRTCRACQSARLRKRAS